jgi:hypothetical protein
VPGLSLFQREWREEANFANVFKGSFAIFAHRGIRVKNIPYSLTTTHE